MAAAAAALIYVTELTIERKVVKFMRSLVECASTITLCVLFYGWLIKKIFG